MKLFFTLLIISVIYIPKELLGQDIDCGSDNVQIGLRVGTSFTAPCDSMVVLTKFTYMKILTEQEILRQQIGQLEIIQFYQDSLITLFRNNNQSLKEYIDFTQPKIDEMSSLFDQSIKN